jgi:DNA invertase Pin-like site-specific DNA recombinase
MEFKKAGADIISIEQPKYSIYVKDPNEFLVNTILEALNHYERMTINIKLAKGRRTKAKSGNKSGGIAPLGYKWNNKKQIEVDPTTAPIVELIFKKYLELGSIGKVVSYLNNNGYRTQRNKDFTKEAVVVILRNDFYKGIVRHADVKIEGKHPVIINKITFGKVQSLLDKNRKV